MHEMQTHPETMQAVQRQETPSYLTTQDVQRLIRVDKSTIYRMAEDGRLPGIKVGRQWRFPADQIYDRLGIKEAPEGTAANGNSTQDLADLFADLYGVMVIVTDIDGHPVTRVSNTCGYFTTVADNDRAVERCIAEWKALGSEYDFRPRLRSSHLGFLCTRAYIRSGNALTGMVIAGGIAPAEWPPTPQVLDAIAAESGADRDLLDARVDQVYRLDDAQQRALVDGVTELARHLSRVASRADTTHPNR